MREKADPDEDMMTFYADAGATRTVLQSDGSIFWNPKDLITIYHNDYHGQFSSTNTAPSASVEFKGVVPNFVRDGNKYFYAFYPYSKEITTDETVFGIQLPNEQTAVEGSFSDDLFISAARTKDDRLHFHNVCGGVKFSVAEDGIKKVVFKANGGESIAGKLHVEFDSDGNPVVSDIEGGSSIVTLTAPGQTTFLKGKWYYLVLAPGTLSQGYSMAFYSNESIGKVSSNSPVVVKRSVWGVLRELVPNDLYAEGSISTSEADLSFYTVPGQAVSRKLEITNTGQKPVTIHSISFEGPFSADFDSETTIGAGGKYAVDVMLTVTAAGTGSGEMTIEYGASQTQKVGLSYEAFDFGIARESDAFNFSMTLDRDCTLSQENGYTEVSYYYGHVEVDETDEMGIEVKNTGTGDIRVMAFGDQGAFYYSRKKPVFDELVSPKRYGYIPFYFSPDRKDEFSGSFVVVVCDAVAPDTNYMCFPIHLSGTSKDITAISFRPTSLDFGQAVVGQETSSQSLTITNVGDHPCTVDIECPEGFRVDKSSVYIDYEYWQSTFRTTVTVTFDPREAKEYSGKIVFTGDNLYGGPFEVEAHGIGVGIGEGLTDLGLSVLWSGCNLGANKPTDYGRYYAWGEIVPDKSLFTLDTYSLYDASVGSYLKYNKQDKLTALDVHDDAAYQTNQVWHIPTSTEWSNLRNNCTWREFEWNGVLGMLATGKKTGYQHRAIFFPYAGGQDEEGTGFVGEYAFLWTSTLSDTENARAVMMGEQKCTTGYEPRFCGASIRPCSTIPVECVSLDKSQLDVALGATAVLTATVLPADVTNPHVTWSSSNEAVATVSATGVVKGIGVGSASITAHSEERGIHATCEVSVIPFEAVDLGLSVKWASFNLGASVPGERGYYYAWGETEPKDDYTWSNYRWAEDGRTELTKYCTQSGYGLGGFTDGQSSLELQDDAAYALLGGGWRMPTKAELDELREKCTWKSARQDGRYGSEVTGPNGRSIFLPYTGTFHNGYIGDSNSSGYYWSNTLGSQYPYQAYCVIASGSYKSTKELSRDTGAAIRPVLDD